MKENSCIRLNPTTREAEIGGSEAFVKTMFNKIQEIIWLWPSFKRVKE